jgi:hypothetical protein
MEVGSLFFGKAFQASPPGTFFIVAQSLSLPFKN